MLNVNAFDLSFPELTYGKNETPWNLRRFLYKGGAATSVRHVEKMIDAGELGPPMIERTELVKKIHETLATTIGQGGRRATVRTKLRVLSLFFQWADQSGTPLDLESLASSYLSWTDALLHRARTGNGVSERTVCSQGKILGPILDRVLERDKPIIKTTRLRMPKRGRRTLSAKVDKENLEDTFAFGHFLLDLSDGLSLDAVWGPLPLNISLRNGVVLKEWSGLKRPETNKVLGLGSIRSAKYLAKRSEERRVAWEKDLTLRTRYPLCNLRIMVEMFMLMGQPAINLAQAHQLRMDQWRFKPSTHGYEVRTYKHRRWGEVVFEIYSEYRKIFDRYLKWRAAIFPDDPDGLLFPLIGYGRHVETTPQFDMIKVRCERAGIKYLPPTALRNTNVNWMLRRTNDPSLTAEEKQHTLKTLISVYEKPSQQRAMAQIKTFWAKHDPTQVAAGPGMCTGQSPEPIIDIPVTATKPDCKTPAGCLFCAHQRDIDSQDHVWSLASYRLLKSFELATHRQPVQKKEQPSHPAELSIERITAKLSFIRKSSSNRDAWVEEALLRVEEGRYHPDWAGLIEGWTSEGNENET